MWGKTKILCFHAAGQMDFQNMVLWIDDVSHNILIGWDEVGAERISDSSSFLTFQRHCAELEWLNFVTTCIPEALNHCLLP